MRAGVVELANLCDEAGAAYLGFEAAAVRCEWLRAFGARADYTALVSFLERAGVQPVPGRAPWAAADAKRGVCPAYAPRGFGDEARARRAAAEAAKASGDGGRLLAAQLGLSDRPEWRPAEGAAAAGAEHLPPSAEVPPPRAAAARPAAAAPPPPAAAASSSLSCDAAAAPAPPALSTE